MSESMEARVEALCSVILKADAENWDQRNRAVIQITDMIRSYEDQPSNIIAEAFTPNVFRALKEPIKLLIADLRSQQVRDACQLLILLSKVTGERMKPLLRDSFVHILEGIKVPNKVMSGYVDECIQSMIRYTVFKTAIVSIAAEVKENKAKNVREKCMEYLSNILSSWELNEKDVEPICEAVRVGLEDASVKVRELSRAAFHTLHQIIPRRMERMKLDLPRSVLQKLQLEESTNGLDISRDSLHELDRSASQLNMSAIKAEFSKAEPPSLAPENLRASSVSRRRSVVKNPFAEISETFAGPLTSNSLDGQDLKAFPKTQSFLVSSPGKSPPGVKSTSSRGSGESFSPKQTDSTAPVSLPSAHKTQTTAPPAAESSSASTTAGAFTPAIGARVYAVVAKDTKVPATVRFNGQTQFAPGIWIGVELESAIGKNNGSVQGHSYFQCRPNYGLFLREENVIPYTNGVPSNGHKPLHSASNGTHHNNSNVSHGVSAQQSYSGHPSPGNAKSSGSVRPAQTTTGKTTRSSGSAASTASNSGETLAEKRAKSASKLKLKLSQMMNFLNQQLEIVEDLEVEEELNPVSTKAVSLRREIKAITDRELETLNSFSSKWKEYL